MGVIPAVIAGVQDIAVFTPPGQKGRVAPEILAAARLAGANRVYRLGGAQAIAAMAFGTESIIAVDKIVGPGNSYVTAAKRLVFGHVDIDMLAGPSEILILADSTSNPAFLAADILAQAEHDVEATAVLVSLDRSMIGKVQAEIALQIEALARREIAATSLARNGWAVEAMDRGDAVRLANAYAPEHLELMLSEPEALLAQVHNAGAVFLGPYTPEAMGDYVSGTNHVLPTGGTARFSSGLSVHSFRKTMSVSKLSKQRFDLLSPHGEIIAQAEGLTAHFASMQIRRRCLT
jgi:histidinol dehydrogenase